MTANDDQLNEELVAGTIEGSVVAVWARELDGIGKSGGAEKQLFDFIDC